MIVRRVVLMALLLILALFVLLSVAAPFFGVDSRPTGLRKWSDPTDSRSVRVRF